MNNSNFFLRGVIYCLIAALPLCSTRSSFAESIVNSKHNLSTTGTGSVKAVTETEICIFCHIPHNAGMQAPLWNRYDSGQIYVPYTSTTSKAAIGQPTGASKLCLSCHDGTVALGLIRSRSNAITFTGALGPKTNLGTDLSDDHPVSFHYDAQLAALSPELKNPSTLTERVRLDQSSFVQCTSCHDPHNNENGYFLSVDARNSNLCIQCHNKTGWTNALHNTSNRPFSGNPPSFQNPNWSTVAEYGCQSCHQPHGALGKQRLLYSAQEESICLTCHGSSVTTKNISAEFNKLSKHPVSNFTGMHDPAEGALVTSQRHVECADCHNPHAANNLDGPELPGSLNLIKGINANGVQVNQISHEYELCFRCHADSNYAARQYVNRQFPEVNTRREFDAANQSFHPVVSNGKNPDVPSLISPLTTSSIIKCTDCHNSDSGPKNGGTGPNGPHGSSYAPILERNQNFADGQSESSNTYALCYKCHNRSNILSDRSFSKHNKHIVESRVSCTACHDPHGARNSTHLINFDRNIVSPYNGQIIFQDDGRFRGNCTLVCHGVSHDQRGY